jgi:hypothetical protein
MIKYELYWNGGEPLRERYSTNIPLRRKQKIRIGGKKYKILRVTDPALVEILDQDILGIVVLRTK